ncbi:hypothetical protein D6D08_04729 [Aureobasidium pullulans]|nr:hypothetical protein D6D08_04729 [Aureobasidium pullulans]
MDALPEQGIRTSAHINCEIRHYLATIFEPLLPYCPVASSPEMLLTRTAVFCPREPFSHHCRKASNSPDMDMSVNHIYAVALSDSASADTPNWAITVQPKKQKRLFFHDHPQTSVFLSTNTDNSERRNSDGFKGEELLVKLLIAENDVAGIDNRRQKPTFRLMAPLRHSRITASSPLQQIQHRRQMATQTLRSQQSHHETVAVEVDFLSELGRTQSVEEMHETREKAMNKKKDSSFFGFRITRPQAMPKKVRRVNSWERQDDAYGGLM